MISHGPRMLVLAMAVLVLAGCVQVRSELSVLEDGTVEGFAEASFPEATLAERGITLDEVLTEFPLGELVTTPGVDDDNRIEQVFAQGDDVIVALRFQAVEATDLGLFGDATPFTRNPDGGFDFDLTVETDGYEPGTRLQLEILFPFEVLDTNGDLDGSTVRWDVEQGSGVRQLTATTNDEVYLSSPAGLGWLAFGMVIAGIVVLGGGCAAWWYTKRSTASGSH